MKYKLIKTDNSINLNNNDFSDFLSEDNSIINLGLNVIKDQSKGLDDLYSSLLNKETLLSKNFIRFSRLNWFKLLEI